MRWADLDLEGGWWTIPATVAKNKLPHRVPLTASATPILEKLKAEAAARAEAAKKTVEPSAHVFAGIRGPRHRREALKGIEMDDLRPHDFRRTAATRMAAAGIARLVIAKVLNHAEKGVTAVYDRASYDTEKRVALQTWERILLGVLTGRDGASVLAFQR
jgi:integrase